VDQAFTVSVSSSSAATETYTRFSFLFTASGSTTTIEFEPTGTATYYGPVIDSVSVVPASGIFGGPIKTSASYIFTVAQGAQATDSIQLTNTDNVLHLANLTVLNPHSDLIVSFADPTVTLAAGETTDIPLAIDAESAAVGSYNDLLIQVTADDGSTLVANLTIYVVAAGTPSLPDLAVSAKGISSTTNADGSVTLTADVHNQGTAPATSVDVDFHDFGTSVGTTTLSQIVAGGDSSASITLPTPVSGDHMIRVVVDPSGTIQELDKTNNEASKIITISASGPATGSILVRGDLPSAVCPSELFAVSGQAVYDITVGGVSNTDYPVKGAPVEITAGSTQYGGMYTDSGGNFLRPLLAPTLAGVYPITMTVTDTTLSGTGNFVVQVLDESKCQGGQAIPIWWPCCGYPPDKTDWKYVWNALKGLWELICPDNNCLPIESQNVYIHSPDIAFLPTHPDRYTDVTIGALIHYDTTSSALTSGQVQVDTYVTAPGASKTEVSQQVLDSIPAGGSSSVFANWQVPVAGIYIVEVDATPLQLAENTQDNDATRAIIVGPYTSGQGVIDGQVSNMTGGVGGVLIQVAGANGTVASTVTDDTGFYLVQSVPVGDYQVTAATQTQAASVADQSVTNVDFALTQPTDTTPPVITPSVSGALGNDGWYIGNVTVSWSVVDNESSVSSKSGCDTATVSTDTTGVTFTCSATSGGGTASQSVTVQRDATPPTISASASPAANGNGWSDTPVTVSFTCNDATSGVLNCASPQVLNEGADQSVSGTATDTAGNSATSQVTGINVDLTPPVVGVTGVTNGSLYTLGAVPVAGCTTTDALSGVGAEATLSVTGGNSDDTGTFTASCSGGLDNAGNPGAASITYQVNAPVAGDLNGDGVVNCADLDIVKASFGKSTGQAGFDPRADVNHDGVVNILDLSFVARLVPAGTSCN
jgi:hypothetical protein